jgi:hypothetical protein
MMAPSSEVGAKESWGNRVLRGGLEMVEDGESYSELVAFAVHSQGRIHGVRKMRNASSSGLRTIEACWQARLGLGG